MFRRWFYLVAATFVAVPQLPAGTIALTFSGGLLGAGIAEPQPYTVGWQFELSTPATVTHLGFYDVDQDGLVITHDVAIWALGGGVLASTVVTNGSQLSEGFLWNEIVPVVLSPGTYRIGSLIDAPAPVAPNCPGDPGDPLDIHTDCYVFGAATISTAPQVTFDGGVYLAGSFGYPTEYAEGNKGRFGPNFQFESNGIPEPATVGMTGFALLAAAAFRRSLARLR